jgi:sulfate transport system permease protein
VFGLIVAWVLVRYASRQARMIDALVDLPFALPTAVAGIALTALYARTAGSASGCRSASRSRFTPLGVSWR